MKLSKFFKDKNGDVVVFQPANPPIVVWAIFLVLSKITNGSVSLVLSFVSSAALIIWAVLEITSGLSPFRRVLGIVVLIFAVSSMLNLLL